MQMTNVKLRLFKLSFCFVVLLLMMGCGNTYKYKGQNFHSPEEALNAQKIDLCDIKSQITPIQKKRGGTAAVVIPTFETFVALGVKKTGNPKQELSDYIGKILVASNSTMYDLIDQRKIFDKVTLIEDNYPIPVVKKIIAEYDVVIYLDLVSPEQAQWFMRVTPDYKIMPLNSDKSKVVRYPGTLSWLENIENNLDETGYMPRR
ncbi:MAG: hypothetical protein Q8O28_04140 [Smithellaceae bacterium]|nr:hypothetical protein [Smithellaceae bacterium]